MGGLINRLIVPTYKFRGFAISDLSKHDKREIKAGWVICKFVNLMNAVDFRSAGRALEL